MSAAALDHTCIPNEMTFAVFNHPTGKTILVESRHKKI